MILVSPLSQIQDAIAQHAPSHLVSLLDPHSMIETPDGIDPERHLKVGVNDVSSLRADVTSPETLHAQQVIDFARAWDRNAPMLIHCWAGVSRSTAAAFITLCVIEHNAPEDAHAQQLRDQAPHANPNTLLVAHADTLLGREGRMIDAVASMSDPQPTDEGELFHLAIKST